MKQIHCNIASAALVGGYAIEEALQHDWMACIVLACIAAAAILSIGVFRIEENPTRRPLV